MNRIIMSILASSLWITLYICIFIGLDEAILRVKLKNPYYAIHALHNALIVYLTIPDIVYTFLHFDELTGHPQNIAALELCFALHFYHTIRYWYKFGLDDWLHHILMIGIALPLGGLLPSTTMLGFSLFFTTGLPGGIDYAILFAVRNGWIDRTTEKIINRKLNVWIRSPGCVAQCALNAAYLFTLEERGLYWYVAFIPGLLNYWNGQYFMENVVADCAVITAKN